MHANQRGQAMIEFAAGAFSLALLLSALVAFGKIIPESTRLQSLARRMAGYAAETSQSGAGEGYQPERIRANLPGGLRDLPGVEVVRENFDFTVELDDIAAEYMFDEETAELKLTEQSYMPVMGLPVIDQTTLLGGEDGGLL